MIRRFACGLNRLVLDYNRHFSLTFCLNNTIENCKMNSEAPMDSLKRKTDETNNDEPDDKRQKVEFKDSVVGQILANTNRARKPKKVVLLLSYLGKEFSGMQRNSNVSTVEEELFKALLKTDLILKCEFDFPKTMKFQRAARTDKGVSAVRQIVSLKIPVKEISDSLPEKVNAHLPSEIRVIGVKRVTQSFDAKIACDARTYAYMLPTFAFAANVEENCETYRINEERINEVNSFLKNYIGTHNFYNFTSGRLPGDPSCKRYIMSCECGPPFESHGIEFSVIKIKGQSFMLHQIRKMVGLAIAFMRNLADSSVLEKTWLNERIDIPKAPGLGLMLEELHYDWYNSKYSTDGIHEALTWEKYDEVVEAFKKEKICDNIAKTEREEKSMLQWLETLPHHSYDVRDAGPPTKLPPKTPSTEAKDVTCDTIGNDDVKPEVGTIEAENGVKSEVGSSKRENGDATSEIGTVESGVKSEDGTIGGEKGDLKCADATKTENNDKTDISTVNAVEAKV